MKVLQFRLWSTPIQLWHMVLMVVGCLLLRPFVVAVYCHLLQGLFYLTDCPSQKVFEKNLLRMNFTYLNQPPFCSNEVRTVLFTPSSPKDFQLRHVIRNTWAKQFSADSRNKFLFLLARTDLFHLDRTVKEESEKFHDILVIDFHDNYFNMSLKIINGLRWIANACPNANFVIRTDSDMVAFKEPLDSFLDFFQRTSVGETGIAGYCRQYDCVMRFPFSKGCMSRQMYSHAFYPRYCFGFGYLFSMNVLRNSLGSINTFSRKYFPLDDILVTGLLAPDSPKMSFPGVFNYQRSFDRLSCRHNFVVSGGYDDPVELEAKWKIYSRRCL